MTAQDLDRAGVARCQFCLGLMPIASICELYAPYRVDGIAKICPSCNGRYVEALKRIEAELDRLKRKALVDFVRRERAKEIVVGVLTEFGVPRRSLFRRMLGGVGVLVGVLGRNTSTEAEGRTKQ